MGQQLSTLTGSLENQTTNQEARNVQRCSLMKGEDGMIFLAMHSEAGSAQNQNVSLNILSYLSKWSGGHHSTK